MFKLASAARAQDSPVAYINLRAMRSFSDIFNS